MNWKQLTKDYFIFSVKERLAVILILFLILIIWLIPSFSSKRPDSAEEKADTAWLASVKRLELKEQQSSENNNQEYENTNTYSFQKSNNRYLNPKKAELFVFDPNTVSPEGWERLGLRDKTIATIQNYLSKGGHFYKPDDLSKIYGLHADEFERLKPYINIANAKSNRPNAGYPEKELASDNKPNYKKPSAKIIDINTADTSAFISLPGIGSKLSARIVAFREKLGGFYSINQVAETYGVPDSTFQKIKPYLLVDKASIKKFNINTATKDELKMHPYIKWNLANAIVEYRNQHGSFSSIEDLKKIVLITDDVFEKIEAYLSL